MVTLHVNQALNPTQTSISTHTNLHISAERHPLPLDFGPVRIPRAPAADTAVAVFVFLK